MSCALQCLGRCNVLGAVVLLCGIVLSKLASMSCTLQFLLCGIVLSKAGINILRAAILLCAIQSAFTVKNVSPVLYFGLAN
jgi:hypothetical protein